MVGGGVMGYFETNLQRLEADVMGTCFLFFVQASFVVLNVGVDGWERHGYDGEGGEKRRIGVVELGSVIRCEMGKDKGRSDAFDDQVVRWVASIEKWEKSIICGKDI